MNRPRKPQSHLFAGLATLALSIASLSAQTVTVDADDVVINGESFFAASNIRDELTRLAREDGVIGATETFRQVAVSGALIAQILGYYMDAEPKPTYVISDGGGNDLMGSCPSPATADCPVVQDAFATVRAYFDSMATNGTEKVLWMRYPDPQGSQWATLKTNQDLFNPLVEQLCDTISTLSCLWVDLRPVWEGHYAEYTSDGIHATDAGGTATAEAFWQAIVDSNFFGGSVTGVTRSGSGAEAFGVRIVSRGVGGTGLNLRIAAPGSHTVRVHDATGRELARRQGRGTAEYRIAEVTRPGLYFVTVNVGARSLVRKVFVGG